MGATTVSNTTETVCLPTASGPMPVVALINGEPFAVYADHLNTPRRLTDAQGRPRWQWAFSGFGEQAAQSIPRANLPTIGYSLRYPGQVDDGNGLFYNFNRFYDPMAGRYTSADPIGLGGGWNRFGYVGGNPLGAVDPTGTVFFVPPLIAWGVPILLGGAWIATHPLNGPMLQDKTPNAGEPGSWHTNPGSGQERLYGPDGRPAADIDWDHDHEPSVGTPHGHNWDWSQKPPRSFPVPISPWPRGRTCP